MDTTKGTHKRFSAFRRKRVTFILKDRFGKLMLVTSIMPLRVMASTHERNIYEGHILKAWSLMPITYRKLDYVGVLVSETDRQWAHRIQWVIEADPHAAVPTKVRRIEEAAHGEA